MSPSADRRTALLVAAALVDLASLVVMLTSGAAVVALGAVAVHLAVTLAAWMILPAGSRRMLATAWVLSLPGIGLVVALAGLRLRGEGDLGQFDRERAPMRAVAPRAVVRLAAAQVPICERLVSGSAKDRRAALDLLATRADADAIELLRWSLRQADGDLALEAALTLEELSARYEMRRRDSRQLFDQAPSFATALAAGDVMLDAICSGLIEHALVAPAAAEARSHFERALALDPTRRLVLTERRARLELAAMRPAAALEILAPELDGPGASTTLTALYNDAMVAARRFSRSSGGDRGTARA